MAEYQSNSHKSKAERAEIAKAAEKKKVKKVVSGKVKTKKNDGRKLASMFISEDAADVKSYVIMDVLIPAIKKAISDIVTDGIDMILYGGKGGNRSSRSAGKVSYRSYYDDRNRSSRDRDRDRDDNRGRGRFDYDDIVFESRGEAELVREQMVEIIDHYGFVTVADMYDMADLTAPYTAAKYGWTNIRTAEAVRIRDGYILKLPKAMPID